LLPVEFMIAGLFELHFSVLVIFTHVLAFSLFLTPNLSPVPVEHVTAFFF
jgi:hypothetical protein